MSVALRILGLVAWLAFLYGMTAWGDTTPALIGAGVGTLLAGALIGRWWALLAPVGLGIFFLVASALSDDTSGDADPIVYGIFSLVAALAFAGVMAIGIAIHKLALRGRTRPQHDRRLGVGRPVT